ncbi:MAG TPA: superoxide dismutase, partial [Cyclobacteriaceae bacterium]|nr:superoxide dismutase [Cyclobacteriaceae bacterium]
MAFTLPKLPYDFNALEPHIDARTMEIHHGKHHNGYVTNLNKAIEGTDAEKMALEDICKNVSKYPVAVRNNG